MKLKHPSNIVVSGPTGSGKTEFVLRLLEKDMLSPSPNNIIWVYGEWQGKYDRLRAIAEKKGIPIDFVYGYKPWIYDRLDIKKRNVLVLDDVMGEMGDSSDLSRLFTQGSHHRNVTVIFIIQNSYHKGKAMRDAMTNAQYRVYFKNNADRLQERTDAQRAYPTNRNFFLKAMEDACKVKHGYLLRDMRADTPDVLRLRTNIFNDETVYVPADTAPDTILEVDKSLV